MNTEARPLQASKPNEVRARSPNHRRGTTHSRLGIVLSQNRNEVICHETNPVASLVILERLFSPGTHYNTSKGNAFQRPAPSNRSLRRQGALRSAPSPACPLDCAARATVPRLIAKGGPLRDLRAGGNDLEPQVGLRRGSPPLATARRRRDRDGRDATRDGRELAGVRRAGPLTDSRRGGKPGSKQATRLTPAGALGLHRGRGGPFEQQDARRSLLSRGPRSPAGGLIEERTLRSAPRPARRAVPDGSRSDPRV